MRCASPGAFNYPHAKERGFDTLQESRKGKKKKKKDSASVGTRRGRLSVIALIACTGLQYIGLISPPRECLDDSKTTTTIATTIKITITIAIAIIAIEAPKPLGSADKPASSF